MRIAQIAPLSVRIGVDMDPVADYLGWLVEVLTDLGHEVTLFGVAGSKCAGRLISTCPAPIMEEFPYWQIRHVLSAELAYGAAAAFDVLHNHVDTLNLPYARRGAAPTLTTVHEHVHEADWRYPVYQTYSDLAYVTIASSQRARFPHDPIDVIAPCASSGPEKVRPGSGRRIMLATDDGYLDHSDLSALSQAVGYEIEWLSGAAAEARRGSDELDRVAVYVDLRMFSTTGAWNAARAMARGIPVVGLPSGFASDLVTTHESGFLAAGSRELAAAIAAAAGLPAGGVQEAFSSKRDPSAAASRYVTLYDALVARTSVAKEESPTCGSPSSRL